MVLRLLTTLAAEKRTFLPAIAASGGDGRQEGNSWVAEIDGSCQTLYHRDQPGGDKARANKALKMIIKVKVAPSKYDNLRPAATHETLLQSAKLLPV